MRGEQIFRKSIKQFKILGASWWWEACYNLWNHKDQVLQRKSYYSIQIFPWDLRYTQKNNATSSKVHCQTVLISSPGFPCDLCQPVSTAALSFFLSTDWLNLWRRKPDSSREMRNDHQWIFFLQHVYSITVSRMFASYRHLLTPSSA